MKLPALFFSLKILSCYGGHYAFVPPLDKAVKIQKKKKTTNYNTFSVFQSYLKLPCLDKIKVEMKNSYAEKINFVFAGNMPDSNSANLFLLS